MSFLIASFLLVFASFGNEKLNFNFKNPYFFYINIFVIIIGNKKD